ncbi:hypothetical protein QJS10_CPB04g01636 [Acorus calamus]|uniref:Uncharacterized protein n=1 Tax=Acorus calamus TaxID=4465 RepID=A0AAV9F2V8_ACOCL|nr:hypothetical protein QJS10_CPB04g01636 [Acorus calamus]
MHPQGMMGVGGFDPTYMARGGGYAGFSGPVYPGMMPSFPGVSTVALPGVAPHVNPAFFGRGMPANGMGMMGGGGMDGHPAAGMWTDTSMGGGGWSGEEHGRRTRESSYGGDDGASEYGYTRRAMREEVVVVVEVGDRIRLVRRRERLSVTGRGTLKGGTVMRGSPTGTGLTGIGTGRRKTDIGTTIGSGSVGGITRMTMTGASPPRGLGASREWPKRRTTGLDLGTRTTVRDGAQTEIFFCRFRTDSI